MKHLFRFHGRRSEDGSWELMDEEWHHILKVLRLSAGDAFEMTDGKGWVAQATLVEAGKSKGSFSVATDFFYPQRSRQSELTIGLGILKPQGIDEILPGLVELGVNRLILVPFLGMEKARVSDKLLERWQRQIIAASKQAKAAWFPELSVMKSFDTFLDTASSYPQRFLLDPEGASDGLKDSVEGPLLALIGSEAGWHESEIQKLERANFKKLRLKSNILRATTAVLATAAIFRQNMNESK